MMERDLALEIATNGVAKRIVDEMGGVTIGGFTLAEKYMEYMYRSCPNRLIEIENNAMALRHWVASVGYNSIDGDFVVTMNSAINQ